MNHLLTQCFPETFPLLLFSSFLHTQYWSTWMDLLFVLVFPQFFTFVAVLFRIITTATLLCRFPFFSTYLNASLPLRILTLSQQPYWGIGDSDWHSLNTASYCHTILWIYELTSSVLLSTSYLTTLIVYRPVLLLILIILIGPCVCFKLMWSDY